MIKSLSILRRHRWQMNNLTIKWNKREKHEQSKLNKWDWGQLCEYKSTSTYVKELKLGFVDWKQSNVAMKEIWKPCSCGVPSFFL